MDTPIERRWREEDLTPTVTGTLTPEEVERVKQAHRDGNPGLKRWRKIKSSVPATSAKYRQEQEELRRDPDSYCPPERRRVATSDNPSTCCPSGTIANLENRCEGESVRNDITYENSRLIKNIYDGLMLLDELYPEGKNWKIKGNDFMDYLKNPGIESIDKIRAIIEYIEEYNKIFEDNGIFVLDEVDFLSEKIYIDILNLLQKDERFTSDEIDEFSEFIENNENSDEDKFLELMNMKEEILGEPLRVVNPEEEIEPDDPEENVAKRRWSDISRHRRGLTDLLSSKSDRAKRRWSDLSRYRRGLTTLQKLEGQKQRELEEEVPRTGQIIDEPGYGKQRARSRWSDISKQRRRLTEQGKLEEEVPRTGQVIDEPGYEKQRARSRWSGIGQNLPRLTEQGKLEEEVPRTGQTIYELPIPQSAADPGKRVRWTDLHGILSEGEESDETDTESIISQEDEEYGQPTFRQPYDLTAPNVRGISSFEPRRSPISRFPIESSPTSRSPSSRLTTQRLPSSRLSERVSSGFKKLTSVLSGPDYQQLLKNNGEQLKELYVSYLNEYFNDMGKGEDINTIKTKYLSFIDQYYKEAIQNDKLLLEKLKDA